MIKLVHISIVIFVLLPALGFSQFKQNIGFSSTYRGFNQVEDAISLNLGYQIQHKIILISGIIGMERWYVRRGNKQKYSFDMSPTQTTKFEFMFGLKKQLFQSNIYFTTSLGARFYLGRNLLDSISLVSPYPLDDTDISLSSTSSVFSKIHGNEIAPGSNLPNNAWGYHIKSIPYTLLSRFEIGYNFNPIGVSICVMPYLIKMNYENKYDQKINGSVFYFFYDVGLGVNYTLPHKKEKANT